MKTSKAFASVALPLIAVSSMLSAAKNNGNGAACEPTPPAACNPDACCRTYCMGPENYGVNAAVNPRTCNGDWVVNIAGFYWNAHQEGLEYAITNDSQQEGWRDTLSYVNARSEGPKFDWDFGFKVGIGYNTTCDGWDFGVNWTWYQGKANSKVEADTNDNTIMLAYLSNYGDVNTYPLATDAEAHWKLKLNLVDIELGREFWNSKRVALRPFIGLRYASIQQDYNVKYKGGSFSVRDTGGLIVLDDAQNDEIKMDNDFKGFGVRAGLNSVWNLGCGWGIYGDLALSMVYGRFDIEVDEESRQAASPHAKTNFTEYENSFRASRYMSDLAIGIQWSSLFCDCQYGLTVALGWEHHMFINQNQLYRFNQKIQQFEADNNGTPTQIDVTNPEINQMRGDLDTQGWTLSVTFDF